MNITNTDVPKSDEEIFLSTGKMNIDEIGSLIFSKSTIMELNCMFSINS